MVQIVVIVRLCHVVPVAQWIAHQTSDLGVGGSSPPWDCFFFVVFVSPVVASLAEWLRRWL